MARLNGDGKKKTKNIYGGGTHLECSSVFSISTNSQLPEWNSNVLLNYSVVETSVKQQSNYYHSYTEWQKQFVN